MGYPPAANQCKVEGCHNGVVARKMCKRHAYGICKRNGCRTIATARGICVKHGAYGKCPIENCGKGAIRWIRFDGMKVKVCRSHSCCAVIQWDWVRHQMPHVFDDTLDKLSPHLQ